MSPGLSATCMVLPAWAEEQLLCHHYKSSRSLLVSTAAAAAFAWNAGVVTRPSTPTRLDTAFAWFKRFNSLSPLTTGLNVLRIVWPQCVQQDTDWWEFEMDTTPVTPTLFLKVKTCKYAVRVAAGCQQ